MRGLSTVPTPRKHASHAARQAAYRQRLAQASQHTPDDTLTSGIHAIGGLTSYRRWAHIAGLAVRLLDDMHTDMFSYSQERSDRWQKSERGEALEEHMDNLLHCMSLLGHIEDNWHTPRRKTGPWGSAPTTTRPNCDQPVIPVPLAAGPAQ